MEIYSFQKPQENNLLQNWSEKEIMKIKVIFQSLKVSSQLIKCEPLSMIWIVTLRNFNQSLIKLNSKWTITLKQYIEVKIQLIDNQKIFNYSNVNINKDKFLRDINIKTKGVYYIEQQTNVLIVCRYKIHHVLHHHKTYLYANFKEIFNEVSFQFHNYTLSANLIKGDKLNNSGIHQFTLKLNQLKECFQWERQSRQKATCVNLSNFQIKNIAEYSQMIEMNKQKVITSTKIYDREVKVNKQKCLVNKNRVWNHIFGIITNQIGKLSSGIADSISIKKRLSENILDCGGFSTVYLGVYQLTYMLTCNMNSINDLIMVQEDQSQNDNIQQDDNIMHQIQIRKELIRKQPTLYEKQQKQSIKSLSNAMRQQDKSLQKRKKKEEGAQMSFSNEKQVIKYLRNAKIPFFAKYFIPTNIDQQFQKGIYLQFYPSNLAKAKQIFKHQQLFKIMKQVLIGIFILWQNKILHRDLKELNILVNHQKNVRIIDLGSCCPMITDKQGSMTKNKDKDSMMDYQRRQIFKIKDINDQNLNVSKTLISTPGYYFSYNSIKAPSLRQKYTKQQFYQAQNFDMYAIGTIITKLFDLYICQDNLYHRQLAYLASKCMQINPQDRYNPSQALCYLFQTHNLFTNQTKINNSPNNLENINNFKTK